MSKFLVTGTNRGLGRLLTDSLAKRGEFVFASVRRKSDESIWNDYKNVRTVVMDVGCDESVEAAAKLLENEPIDVLINNAGAAHAGASEWADHGNNDIQKMLDDYNVNALGVIRTIKAFLPHIHAGQRKLVVNISSEMGSIGRNVLGGWRGYRMSKAAQNMATKGYSLDLKNDGVTVVCLDPGWTKTDMGGPRARYDPQVSVNGMIRVIDGLSATDTGKFFNFNGMELPW